MTAGARDGAGEARERIVGMLGEHGSVELVANIAMMEQIAKSPAFRHTPAVFGEPLAAYVAGLFLSSNNLAAGEPDPERTEELAGLVDDYFDKFKASLAHSAREGGDPGPVRYDPWMFRLQDDTSPHAYLHRGEDYLREVFLPLDDHYVSRHGFSVGFAMDFASKFASWLAGRIEERTGDFRDAHGGGDDGMWGVFGHARIHASMHSRDDLAMSVDRFCEELGIADRGMLASLLEGISCSFGGQFEGFGDVLSGNVILCKPVIRLNRETFFVPKPDILFHNLDRVLEYMLEGGDGGVRDALARSKSSYLRDRSYELVSRVFPPECVFRNVYYRAGDEVRQVELLVMYDNNVFIMGSDAGSRGPVPRAAGPRGACDAAADYARSSRDAVFWEDPGGTREAARVDALQARHELFCVVVTPGHVAGAGPWDPRPPARCRPTWTVPMHDLEMLTRLLPEPIYFVHYARQRLDPGRPDMGYYTDHLCLSLYLGYGRIHPPHLDDDGILDRYMSPESMRLIEDHCLHGGRAPQVHVPKALGELLLNMQKYRQRGFTDVTSLLLDFAEDGKKSISKDLTYVFSQAAKNGDHMRSIIWAEHPYGVGFAYHAADGMDGFYRHCKQELEEAWESNPPDVRWAMIGRNIRDKRNHATFFLYKPARGPAPGGA